MTDPTRAAVAVPVELLKRVLALQMTIQLDAEVRALIPKPTPRLVAVDLHADHPGPLYLDELRDKPDLLTLLDEAVDSGWLDPNASSGLIQARIRAALGVTN